MRRRIIPWTLAALMLWACAEDEAGVCPSCPEVPKVATAKEEAAPKDDGIPGPVLDRLRLEAEAARALIEALDVLMDTGGDLAQAKRAYSELSEPARWGGIPILRTLATSLGLVSDDALEILHGGRVDALLGASFEPEDPQGKIVAEAFLEMDQVRADLCGLRRLLDMIAALPEERDLFEPPGTSVSVLAPWDPEGRTHAFVVERLGAPKQKKRVDEMEVFEPASSDDTNFRRRMEQRVVAWDELEVRPFGETRATMAQTHEVYSMDLGPWAEPLFQELRLQQIDADKGLDLLLRATARSASNTRIHAVQAYRRACRILERGCDEKLLEGPVPQTLVEVEPSPKVMAPAKLQGILGARKTGPSAWEQWLDAEEKQRTEGVVMRKRIGRKGGHGRLDEYDQIRDRGALGVVWTAAKRDPDTMFGKPHLSDPASLSATKTGKTTISSGEGRPRVESGKMEVSSGLDRTVVEKYIRKQLGAVKWCYKKALQRNPEFQGKLKVSFVISPRGKVIESKVVETDFNDSEMVDCVETKVLRWRFPSPQDGGVVRVTYPFVFKTAD